MQNKGFYLTGPKKKNRLFSGWRKKAPRSNKSNRRVGNTAVGRGIWYASVDFFSDSRLTAFANSAYPENWNLLFEALSMPDTKMNWCSQGNCTSHSTLSKTFLSAYNFVSKINKFLSKIPLTLHTFVKHKGYWILNITQSLGVRHFWSFLELN